MQAFHGLGDDIEVLGGVQGHRSAGFCAQFMRPHARAVDHHVGADFAEFGAYADGFAVFDQDFLGRAIFENARTPAFSAFRQRLRGVNRVGTAVFGQVDATDHIGDIDAWP